MRLVEYVAIFKQLDDIFVGFFPDIPSIRIVGDTLVVAKENAFSCLRKVVLEVDVLPEMTSFEELEALFSDDIVSIVQVNV